MRRQLLLELFANLQSVPGAQLPPSQQEIGAALQEAQVDVQPVRQAPLRQSACEMHSLPQAPQSVSVRRSVSHPLPGRPSQSPRSAAQARPQVPPVHVATAPGPPGHALPQLPQVAGSARSASQPLLASPSQSSKPAAQVRLQARAAHDAVAFAPVGQASPQPPQWDTSVRRSTSQPLAALPSQSSKLGAQVMPHARAAQVAVAFGPLGQVAPHPPQ